MAARILIVDDHEIVRQGIRTLLTESRPEWEICGEAANGAEAVEAVKSLQPDVVVLDVTMPVMNGLQAASEIARLGLRSSVLLFTMHESAQFIIEVRQARAQGYVMKSQASRDLVLAIDVVLTGGTFFSMIQDDAPPLEHTHSEPEQVESKQAELSGDQKDEPDLGMTLPEPEPSA